MSESLFSNTIISAAPLAVLNRILADPTQLPAWNFAVTNVTPVDAGFQLTRQDTPFNPTESLTVTTAANQVTYHSRDGRWAYDLTFTLSPEANATRIQEDLVVSPTSTLLGPLHLFVPQMKRAFAQNLQTLVDLAETTAGSHQ